MSYSPEIQPIHGPGIQQPSSITAWHVHVGTIQLFIVGHGPNAWCPASVPQYQGRVGTDEERNIARRACEILNQELRYTKDAGPVEIKAALAVAALEKCVSPNSQLS